jgi:hypothetical protein
MTIDEAIFHLSHLKEEGCTQERAYYGKALNLGISALKAYQYFRSQQMQGLLPNLPGETPSTPTPEQERAARGDRE